VLSEQFALVSTTEYNYFGIIIFTKSSYQPKKREEFEYVKFYVIATLTGEIFVLVKLLALT